MGVKILFFSRGTLGQNSMFPETGGQNSIFFPSALKKGGQNRGAYQPTSLKGCPPRAGIPIRGQLFCFIGPEINFGFISEFSRTHGTKPPINFRVEMKACFCRIKWISYTTEIAFIWRENRHFLLVHGHWRRGQFSHGRWVWRFGGIWLAYRYYA